MNLRHALRRVVTPPLVLVAVLVVLFEATLWRWVGVFGGWVSARLPFFAVVERLVDRLSPRSVCVIFAIPLSLLVPGELGGAWLVYEHHYLAGPALAALVKFLCTAFSARLFAVARPKLMQVRAFVWSYRLVTRWIAFAHAYADALPGWRTAKQVTRSALRWTSAGRRGRLAYRFAAARRRAGRRGVASRRGIAV